MRFNLIDLGVLISLLPRTLSEVLRQQCHDSEPLARNPGDCSTYLQCIHGQWKIRICPQGLQFNHRRHICDYPSNFNCIDAEWTVGPPSRFPTPECYSCVYVEKHGNLSIADCARNPPSHNYKTRECFGFGDVAVAASIRHGRENGGRDESNKVYCVTYKGRSELDGSLVILRGCEFAPKSKDFGEEQCFFSGEYDFVFPRLGFVRNVEKCYCKGNNCNGWEGNAGQMILPTLSRSFNVFSFFTILVIFDCML